MLHKNVKYARLLNPVLVTIGFALDNPIWIVYTDYYKILTIMATSAELFLVPWSVCETLLGQLVSFLICYIIMLASFHQHYDVAFELKKVAPHFLIFFAVNVYIFNDIPVAYKDVIQNQIDM